MSSRDSTDEGAWRASASTTSLNPYQHFHILRFLKTIGTFTAYTSTFQVNLEGVIS